MNLITIGLPVYNSRSTIDLCLQSIYAQSEQEWELVIVDDGSSDGSAEWLISIKDPRVRVIADGKHLGLVARLNQIAELAQGKYLARMDSDDIMMPDRIATQVRFLEAHPTVDVVGSSALAFPDGSESWRVWRRLEESAGMESLLRSAMFIHPTIVGKTAWFRENPYREKYYRAEDMELWCRARPHSEYALLRQPLLFYRVGGRSYLRRYIASEMTVARIQIEYGPPVLGWMHTMRLAATTAAKIAGMSFLCTLGLGKRYQANKGQALTADQASAARDSLGLIRRTQVPIRDSSPIQVSKTNP